MSNSDDFKDSLKYEKLEHINNRMNKITKELTKNVSISEDMLTTTEELSEFLSNAPKSLVLNSSDIDNTDRSEDQIQKVTLDPIDEVAGTVVDVSAMKSDFEYMREMLKLATNNSKRILESITEDLIYSDGESRAELIIAYSELNKSQMESIKLFINSYKEISTILVNLSKVSNAGTPHTVHTTNVLNIENENKVSAADVVNRLKASQSESIDKS